MNQPESAIYEKIKKLTLRTTRQQVFVTRHMLVAQTHCFKTMDTIIFDNKPVFKMSHHESIRTSLGVHQVELVVHATDDLGNRRRVRSHQRRAVHLREIAAGNGCARLVVDTNLREDK